MKKEKILITGAAGQLGQVLAEHLIKEVGAEQVVLSDIREIVHHTAKSVVLDIMQYEDILACIERENITVIFHLAALLSAKGEANPKLTKRVNSDGYFNILEASRVASISKVFFPSSIAVFGEHVPKRAPQYSPLHPTTAYGITKAEGENWGQYFHDKYGVDVRSLRFPGVIGYRSMPGGGTTDYAVDIFYSAIKGEKFTCFLEANERLPMIYMEDALSAIEQLMAADSNDIRVRSSYNLNGLSFSPEEIAGEIRKHIPDFEIEYKPDFRQSIATSWPDSLEDAEAKKDWGWKPKYNLSRLVEDMIQNLKKNIN